MRAVRRGGILASGLAALALATAGCATPAARKPDAAAAGPAARPPAGGAADAERFGVEPLGVRLSAAGYMLDFRLRVRSPEKAAPLLARKAPCYVVVEKSGGVLAVASSPKIGALRATVRTPEMVKRDRVYGALFANPGRHVKPGDRVTVVMGGFRAEHVLVE